MGRQVNFYMTTEDEKVFLDFVWRSGDVIVLPSTSLEPNFQPAKELAEPFSTKSWFSYVFFNRRISKNLVTRRATGADHYRVDVLRSSVIEFHRAGVKEKRFRPGRIWAQFNFLDQEKKAMLPKEPAFEEWYETIAKWLHGNYRHFDRGFYLSPSAQKLREQGVELLLY